MASPPGQYFPGSHMSHCDALNKSVLLEYVPGRQGNLVAEPVPVKMGKTVGRIKMLILYNNK